MTPANLGETIYEQALKLVVIAAILIACFIITAPFFGALVWAVVIAVSIWPLFVHLSDRCGGRRKLAALLISLLLALILVAPGGLLLFSLAEHVQSVGKLASDLTTVRFPAPPAWLTEIPLVGTTLQTRWIESSGDLGALFEKIRPYIGKVVHWVLGQGEHLGLAFLQFLLAVVIAGILFVHGDAAADLAKRLTTRLGGEKGRALVGLAEQTIRGVAVGVIGTAFIQGILMGFGFALAGAPGFILLGFLCLILAMLQIGPGPVWIAVAIWLSYQGRPGWAIFIVGWGVAVSLLEHFIKPYLISQGSGLPLAIIFIGVVGGLLAWGFIGIFLGPTLLALGYTLLINWIGGESEASAV